MRTVLELAPNYVYIAAPASVAGAAIGAGIYALVHGRRRRHERELPWKFGPRPPE